MNFMSYAAMWISEEIWNTITAAFDVNRSLLEETMTDLSLLNLSQETKTSMTVKDYSKKQENLDGGDWAWFFIYPSGRGLGIRVQAKIMHMKNPADFSHPFYKQLHYSPKKPPGLPPGEQTRRLIKSSYRDRMIPMYCLFTAYDKSFINKSQCIFRQNGLTKGFGMTLVGAEVIDKLLSTQIHFDDFAAESHALPCLFEHALNPRLLANYCLNRWPLDNYNNPDRLLLSVQDLRQLDILQIYFQEEDLDESNSFPEDDLLSLLPPDVYRLTVFKLSVEISDEFLEEIDDLPNLL